MEREEPELETRYDDYIVFRRRMQQTEIRTKGRMLIKGSWAPSSATSMNWKGIWECA